MENLKISALKFAIFKNQFFLKTCQPAQSSLTKILAYFRFYWLFPVKACFQEISLHNRSIRAWDSPNWSLGPDKGFWFSKLGIGVPWGHLGSKYKIFKPWENIYQNAALAPFIKKKWFSRSSEVTWPQIEGLRCQLGSN